MQALASARWIRVDRLCLADLPDYGDVSGVYMMRRAATGEVIYIGSTDTLRRRLFGNHLGGVGGATTQRVHAELFAPEVIAGVEVAWVLSDDWKGLEIEMKREFAALGGAALPAWVRR
jgi:predicted GIY-YIG superfamily endonuclease